MEDCRSVAVGRSVAADFVGHLVLGGGIEEGNVRK